MVKLIKSALLWQVTAGFALGTIGMVAWQPADASNIAARLIAATPLR
ncbi:MAG: hypothetical protein K2X73_14820 [Sphingomonas sp.]|jgi:hypothetical protein|nr:hypothetical protein [Sphingomonas sp.]MBX9883231.1 hypothetical protein [Sphingomonas sp.]